MPRCPVHVQEDLEPKRKGWFCEECGAIVLGYQESPLPAGVAAGGTDGPAGRLADAVAGRDEITRPRPAVTKTHDEQLEISAGEVTWGATIRQSREAALRTVERIRRGRRNPELHVERAWFDETMAAAVMREGRAVLLLGEPGMGKTTWACRWVAAALEDAAAEDAVVFLSGAWAWTGTGKRGSGLLDAVVSAAGIKRGAFASMAEMLERLGAERSVDGAAGQASRRLVLLLDGIDEATDSGKMLGEVDELLKEVGRYSWLRVIVTMRRGAYDVASEHAPGNVDPPCPFRNARWLLTFHDVATGQALPYEEVRPWREDTEARSAYEVMQRSSPETSASFRWDKLTPPLRRLLCTPWCLPVFHDAFAGVDEPPSSLDAIGLTQAWFSCIERSVPGVGALLDEIGSAAMHGRRLDVIDNAVTGWRTAQGEAAHERAAALQSCGLLAEAPGGTQFRHDRMAEAVLARELMRRIAPRVVPSSDLLLTWAKSAGKPKGADAFPALTGALELLVTRWVTDGESGFVASLLDLEHDDVRQRLVGASLRALGPGWGDQGQAGPAATRLLEVLGAASSKPERAKRLLGAAWTSVGWLQARGHTRAADELVRRLVALTRGLVARSLDTEDKRLFGCALCTLARQAELLGNREDARRCAEDAMRLVHEVTSAGKPDPVLLRVQATALLQVARMASRDGERARARTRGEEALRAARKLVELRGGEASSHKLLVQALIALSDAALQEGNPVQARGCAEEAGSAARAAVDAFGWDPDLRRSRAESDAVLARIHRSEKDGAAARELTDSALRAMRKLVRSEPQRADHRLDLAAMLEGHTAQLLADHDDDLARRALDEAAGLMIALVEAHPDQLAWLHRVSQLLVTLGLVLRARGESESSRACFEEAVRHARTYVGRGDAPMARSDLVMALAQLGHLEAVDGRRSEARRAFREAFEIVRGLDPSSSQLDEPPRVAAMLLTALGRLAADDGDVEGARWHVGEALKELTSWMALRPGRIDLQSDLCQVMSVRAELASDGIARPRRPSRYRFAITVREPGVPEVKEYFDRDEITIGRAPGSDLMLPNYSVSRQHAVVRYEHGRFTIADLGSKHGTKVNGARVSGRTEVALGDRVDLGDFALQFEVGPTPAAHDTSDEDPPKEVSQAETRPPPPMPPRQPTGKEERKEITIDLDVGDFVEVVDKVEEA